MARRYRHHAGPWWVLILVGPALVDAHLGGRCGPAAGTTSISDVCRPAAGITGRAAPAGERSARLRSAVAQRVHGRGHLGLAVELQAYLLQRIGQCTGIIVTQRRVTNLAAVT